MQQHCFDLQVNLMYEWDISSLIYALSGSRYVENLGAAQLLLTPWNRVLPVQLTFPQLVKKFLAIFGTRKFIATFTSDHHLSPIPSYSSIFHAPHSTSWRHILILFSHLHLDITSDIFLSGFPAKTLYAPLLSPIRPLLAIFMFSWR